MNGTTVLGAYPLRWLVDRFFRESIGLSYDSLVNGVFSSWVGDGNPPLPRFENLIIKVVFHTDNVASAVLSPSPVAERNNFILLVQFSAQAAVPDEIGIRMACPSRWLRSASGANEVFGTAWVPSTRMRISNNHSTRMSRSRDFSSYCLTYP